MLNINNGFFVPVPKSENEGNFLQVVDGAPTWQSLPIYAGEVE